MKKIVLGILLAVFITSLTSSKVFAACGDGDTADYCGAKGECPSGQICYDGWWPNDAKCNVDARCNPDAIDQSVYRCGYSNTNNWCGGLGGCAAGYKCDGATYTCVADSTFCEHKNQLTTGIQCGVGYASTNRQCGEYGGCENGYRCVINDAGVGSCEADDISTTAANRCPGTPTKDPVTLSCGEETDNPNVTCNCTGNSSVSTYRKASTATVMNCCGWVRNDSCAATAATQPDPNPDNGGGGNNTPDPQPDPDNGGTGGDGSNGNGSSGDTTPKIDIFAGPTSEEFNLLNPLKTFGTPAVTAELSSPGGVISRILAFAFPIAGLILFLMLVIAGFQIVAGGANGTKAIEAGRQRATNALIGFVLLFVAYWLMQIIEVIFGITIF